MKMEMVNFRLVNSSGCRQNLTVDLPSMGLVVVFYIDVNTKTGYVPYSVIKDAAEKTIEGGLFVGDENDAAAKRFRTIIGSRYDCRCRISVEEDVEGQCFAVCDSDGRKQKIKCPAMRAELTYRNERNRLDYLRLFEIYGKNPRPSQYDGHAEWEEWEERVKGEFRKALGNKAEIEIRQRPKT